MGHYLFLIFNVNIVLILCFIQVNNKLNNQYNYYNFFFNVLFINYLNVHIFFFLIFYKLSFLFLNNFFKSINYIDYIIFHQHLSTLNITFLMYLHILIIHFFFILFYYLINLKSNIFTINNHLFVDYFNIFIKILIFLLSLL